MTALFTAKQLKTGEVLYQSRKTGRKYVIFMADGLASVRYGRNLISTSSSKLHDVIPLIEQADLTIAEEGVDAEVSGEVHQQ